MKQHESTNIVRHAVPLQ